MDNNRPVEGDDAVVEAMGGEVNDDGTPVVDPDNSANPPAEPSSETQKDGDPPTDPGSETQPTDPPTPDPAADPPASPENPDPPTTSAEQTKAIIDSFFNEKSEGVFKTAEEFEKLKGFETLQSVPNLTEQLQNLEENKVEFANDFIKSLNDYHAKGGTNTELFVTLQGMKVDEMEPLDVLKTQMKFAHPTLTDEQISTHLAGKYNQLSEEDEGYSEGAVKQGEISMTIDSGEAKEYLKNMQTEIHTPDPEKERLAGETAETDRLTKWDPIISKTVTDFTQLTIPLNEKGASFNYDIPEDVKVELQQQLKESLEYSGAELDNDGGETAKQMLFNRYLVDNFDNIARAIAEKSRSMTDEQWIKEINNPSAVKTEDVVPPDPNTEKDVIDQIMKLEGIS